MPIYLSWNVYHGTPPAGGTPSERIQHIIQVGMAHNVDVLCLQEVPGKLLDPGTAFGVAAAPKAQIITHLNNHVPGWNLTYVALQALSENNNNKPHAATTSDGYLIFYRRATFNANAGFGYFQSANFQTLGAVSFLRPPVAVKLTLAGGAVVTVMNWHADAAAAWSTTAIAALNGLLGNANAAPRTVVCGDFNYAGPINNVLAGIGIPPFPNWTDLRNQVTNALGVVVSDGLDHILTSGNANSVLEAQLEFSSDAYHFPLAVNF